LLDVEMFLVCSYLCISILQRKSFSANKGIALNENFETTVIYWLSIGTGAVRASGKYRSRPDPGH
jgi:hypothetical protein